MTSQLAYLAATARHHLPAADPQSIHAAGLRSANKKRRRLPRPVIAGAARFGITGLDARRAKSA
jgi:hypothetical protein